MGDLFRLCALVLLGACAFDPSGSTGESTDAAAVDADPTSPDADPDRPDADPTLPDADDMPACASTYTLTSGSSRYRVGTDATWYEARAACEAEGARLVVIEDQGENDFVLGLEPEGSIWIGMSDHVQEQTFTWLTGASAMGAGGLYEDWIGGQPNDNVGGEDCGELDNSSGWNDLGCATSQAYVCECNGPPATEPPTWCVTRTNTDCDICGDDCTPGGGVCSGDECVIVQ